MKPLSLFFTFLVSLLFLKTIVAQHDHKSRPNEIGLASGAVINHAEENIAPGFHIHYTRMLSGKLESFGIGPGFEVIFDEHIHYNGSFLFTWRPVRQLWISAGPGVTYVQEDEVFLLAGHLESGYEFEAGSIHIGPMVGYAETGGERHFMVGLHIGLPF